MFDAAMRVWLDLAVVSLMQGTMVVGAVHLALKSASSVTPALRHRILFGTLVALIALPAVLLAIPRPRLAIAPSADELNLYATSSHVRDAVSPAEKPALPSAGTDTRRAALPSDAAASSTTFPRFAKRIPRVDATSLLPIAVTWMTVSGLLLLRLVFAGIAVRRILSSCASPDAALLARVTRFMDRDRARLLVRVSTSVRAPMTIGVGRMKIVVPAALPDELTDAELEHVLRHELAHVERRDSLTNLAQQLCVATLWFHPVAWWLSRRILTEREIACDAVVAQQTGDARSYARSLVHVAELTRGAPLLVLGSAVVSRSGLSTRIERLVHCAKPVTHFARATAAGAGLVFVFAAAASPRIEFDVSSPRARGAPGASGASAALARADDAAIAERIDRTLQTYAENGFSGVVLVAHNGRVVLRNGYGAADRERGIAMTPATYFSSAGMTKALTATDAALLEHDGLLRMGDPVARYVEAMRGPKADVTIHNLLTHTDGIARPGALVASANRATFVDAMRATPVAYRPGTATRYTDVGYSLLGVAIEEIAGKKFEDFTRERVLTPLGMNASRFEGEALPRGAVLAREYAGPVGDQHALPAREYVWGRRASLGFMTTADDLYRLLLATEHPGPLPEAVRSRLLTPNTRTAPNSAEGYGWETMDSWYGTRVHRRLAGTPGFEGELLHDVDDGWDAVILVNSAVGWRYAVWSEIALAFRGRPAAPLDQILARRRYAPYQGGRVTPLITTTAPTP